MTTIQIDRQAIIDAVAELLYYFARTKRAAGAIPEELYSAIQPTDDDTAAMTDAYALAVEELPKVIAQSTVVNTESANSYTTEISHSSDELPTVKAWIKEYLILHIFNQWITGKVQPQEAELYAVRLYETGRKLLIRSNVWLNAKRVSHPFRIN